VRAAGALSTHPIVATALGECAGQVLEALDGARPSFALVAVTPPHLGTLEDVGSTLRAVLDPGVILGAVSSAVVGAGLHVEAVPALTLFALTGIEATPLLLEPDRRGALRRHADTRTDAHRATAGVVLADPFSCPAPALVAALDGVEVCGGLLGAARGPGGSRLLLDGAVRTSGAVGVLLGPPARAAASQGGTPVGPTWVITRAEGDDVLELGGRPAGERRREALGDLARPGPTGLGLVVDEQAERPDRDALRVVRVRGPGPGGGLRLAEPLAVGRVVRFVRLGPAEVEGDLVTTLANGGGGRRASLLFPGPDRARDAGLAAELLGMMTAGVGVGAPLAPLAGVTALHGADATGLLLLP